MSTPSMATAALPPPHASCYGYGDYGGYQQTPSYSTVEGSASRLAKAYRPFSDASNAASPSMQRALSHGSRHTMQPNLNVSQSTSVASERSRGRAPRKAVNWAEFYKNGVPKEVIVIDDDSPEQSSQVLVKQDAYLAVNGNLIDDVQSHPNKRRRTLVNYDPYDPASQFERNAFLNSSNSASYSADRTTSIQTTAPTSLGSHASSGDSIGYADSAAVGQKRKRVTRKSVRDEAKRREVQYSNIYNDYRPPSAPIVKAKDVKVPVIREPYYNKNEKIDDNNGHYVVFPNTNITERYTIYKLLGQGTFGKVVEAFDKRRKTRVAIKIIRAVEKYRDASKIELRVLATLASNDKENRNKCIHLRDCFDFRNHICIVTDLLGQSVFDFLKGNQFVPFPGTHIQSFARQLLTSVAFLHDLNLVHTDLKPENILLVHNEYQTYSYRRSIPSSSTGQHRRVDNRKVLIDPEIRLIDFGSATFNDEYHSSVVSTRHYRAPEIILDLGWSFPCDIWSIGCILVEFFTGDALFQTHDNLEHLAMMEAVVSSRIDPKLVKQVMQGSRGNSANQAAKYFGRGQKLNYPNADTGKASKRYVKAMKKLDDIIQPTNEFNRKFLDLLRKIFVYDPKQRITAKEALKHPWFRETIVDDGTQAQKIGIDRRAQGLV